MTITDHLVERVRALRYERLPIQAVEMARHVCLDGIGVTLAGANEPHGLGSLVTRYVREVGGRPHASVIAGGFKTSMTNAAFANGTMAHALDFDNTWYPMNHPTSPTLPAILAIAEHYGHGGREVITAIIAAFEVQARLRMASTGLHSGLGFHKPGTTGLVGAVTAGVTLLELDHDQAKMAFGIAGSRAGSLSINTGTMTKASHSGHAARMGLESAHLASMGWTAAPDVFGPSGFFDTFLGEEQEPELLLRGFGDPFRIVEPGVGFKKYPSNYFTHRSIDAALAIRNRPDFDIAELASVKVYFPDLSYVNRPQPETGLDGKFSVQYTTALALLDGRITIDSFTNQRRFSDDIEELLRRIVVDTDPHIPKEFERVYVVVVAHMRDGREFSERVDELSGMPGVPLSGQQRMDKYLMCAGRVLNHENAIMLATLVEELNKLDDVRGVMQIACGCGSTLAGLSSPAPTREHQ